MLNIYRKQSNILVLVATRVSQSLFDRFYDPKEYVTFPADSSQPSRILKGA